MDQNDRQAIEGLFTKLSKVEQQSGPRDAEAEKFISDHVSTQPGAPYFMAQTIVVQEQALAAAQERIAQLEAQEPEQAPQQQRGGMFANMFGGGASVQPATSRQAGTVPSVGRGGPWGQQGEAASQPMQQGRAGGGFLAGAAQTAMGVAGGVLLGSAIGSMFGGSEANAAETPKAAEPAPAEEPVEDNQDFGGADDGGDFEF
jgi:hypothetical protein